MLRWVKASHYCAMSGDTPDSISKRLRTGIWLRDVHARRPAGSRELWVNLAAVNDWAEGVLAPHLHGHKTGR